MGTRMTADQEIRDDAALPAAALQISGEVVAGKHRTLLRGRDEFQLPVTEEFLERRYVTESRKDLRENTLAYHQLALCCCLAQDPLGRLGEIWIIRDDIQYDGAVDGRNHSRALLR